jgi:SsrA-binding protein
LHHVKTINIYNKRCDYEIIEHLLESLAGTEIKSIHSSSLLQKVEFSNLELFIINTYIEEYFENQFNHKARSERKLLLK